MSCPNCERPTPEAAAFCPSCGSALAPASSVLALGEERRVVTVVFADLVGFTAMAERLDPEQVKRLVDGCFSRLVADIDAHGGRVDKILGDGILALFGAPIAHEDDAERGVRASLAMQATVAAYAHEVGTPIQLRVGVTTGEVLVGALRAGGDYTALGDVVNLASRLQGVARPGQVLVGPHTYTATAESIAYEPAGAVTVRGRAEAIDAWVAGAPIGLPGARVMRDRLPLVGRDEELASLTETLRLGLRRQRPIVVAIEGEGGIGKSRLADEAVAAMVAEFDALTLSGRCLPYGESAPLAPLAYGLRALLGLAEEGLVERDAIMAAVTATGSELTLAPERVADGLLHLQGEPSPLDAIDPVSAMDEVVRSVAAYLAAVARRRPVVIRLSDINWADSLLVDVLTRILPQLASVPLAMVTTARPDEATAWPPRGGHHSSFVLHLDPLPVPAAEELVTLLLGDSTDVGTRRDLLARSGGNPLFIEQLAALVAESDGAGVGLPATLRGMIAARLDALSVDERAMLDNAAVLGTSGRWRRLELFSRAMNQVPRRSTLDALAAADLFVVDGNSWRFRSASVRDVAYEMLTKQARAQRHAGVAQAVEAQEAQVHAGRDQSETLAYHWSQAAQLVREIGPVRNVPADAEARAVHWLTVAAERAIDRQVFAAVERYANSALELLDTSGLAGDASSAATDGAAAVDPRIGLLHARAQARLGQRSFDGARADLDAVLTMAAAAPERLGRARAESLRLLGMVEHYAGHTALAESTLQAAVDAFRELGDGCGLASALRTVGMIGILAGRFVDADDALAEAHALYSAAGDRRGLAWVNQHRAWTAFVRGDVTLADTRLDEAEVTFAALGDPSGLGWVRGLRAFIRFHQGRLDEAEALAGAGLKEASERGDKWAAAQLQVLLSGLRLWSGRIAEGLEFAERARNGFRSIDDRYGEAQAMGALVRALVASGRGGDAQRELERMVSTADTPPRRAWASLLVAGAAVHQGEALRGYVAAQDALVELVTGIAASEAWAALGLAQLQLGDGDRALAAAEAACSLDPAAAYPTAVLAAAAVAAGNDEVGMSSADAVMSHPGASYLDRAIAASAVAVVSAARGDAAGAKDATNELDATAHDTGDPGVAVMATTARSIVERLASAGAPPPPPAEQVPVGWARALTAMAAGTMSLRR